MPRTISDEEYNHLIGRAQVADFVEPIWNNPATSKKAKALVKEAYPNLEIPGYDTETEVDRKLRERDERDAEKERKAREAEEDRVWRAERERVRDANRFSDDDMSAVEKLMVDRKIGDYEVAAEHYRSRLPKPSAPTYDNHWNHTQQTDFGEISKDPEAWARKQILGAIERDQEAMRGGR